VLDPDPAFDPEYAKEHGIELKTTNKPDQGRS